MILSPAIPSFVIPAKGSHRSNTSMGPKAGISLRPHGTHLAGTPASAGVTAHGGRHA